MTERVFSIGGQTVDVIIQGGVFVPGPPGEGLPGPPGAAATINVGTTTTGAAGTDALVVNAGSSSSAILNFTIPRGNTGLPGTNGTNGAAATIAVGTVTTGAPGSSAIITNAGTSSAAVFNFTIPRGDTGTGDVTGPASATADAPAVFNGTTGKLIKVGAFPVLSVAGLTGTIASGALKTALTLVKADVGLGNVDNTSDANKPVSTAQQTALDLKSSLSDVLNTQTGTTYTLQASDNGKVVELGNAAAITLTLPNSLAVGFNCLIRQTGAGQVTVTPASGATRRNRQSHTKLAGQWSEAALSVRTNAGGTAAEYVFSGDTAA